MIHGNENLQDDQDEHDATVKMTPAQQKAFVAKLSQLKPASDKGSLSDVSL